MKRFSKMKYTKASFVTVLFISLAMIMGSAQKPGDDEELKIGKKMPLPTYTMEGADGESYTLSELMGENGLIVVFSCNTCPFVVGSENFAGWEGQYNDLFEKATANKMGMVLVNSNSAKRDGDDSKDAMKEHSDAQGYSMPYLVDKDAKLADAMGAKTTPHVFVFNGTNKLVYKGSIDNSWDTKKTELETYLIDAIEAIGNGKTIETSSSTPRGCSIKRTN